MVEAHPRSKQRRVPARRLALGLAALVGALAAVAGGDAAWSLRAAQEDAERATRAFARGDLSAASGEYEAAAERFRRGERSLRLLEAAFGWLPLASGNIRLARADAGSGRAAATAAARLTSLLDEMEAESSFLHLRPLRENEASLSAATTALSASLEELEGIETGRTLTPLARFRRVLLDQGWPLLRTVSALHAAAALAAPGRSYLLVVQNPAELRATGGLIGAWGLLTTDGKRVRLARLARNTALPQPRTPAAAPADYRARYARFGAERGWVNANMSPDFPTSARVLLDLYRSATSRHLDGVVSVDAVALERLLAATGPVTVEGREFTRQSFLHAALVDSYAESSRSRVDMLLAAAREGWSRLGSGVRPLAVSRALGDAASMGHIRAFALEREAQASLEGAGVGGLVTTPPGDYLLLVRQNAGGNKLDYYARSRLVHRVRLDGNGNARSRVTVELQNGAPKEGLSSYAAGVLAPGERPGRNRSYLSLYAPPSADLVAFRSQRETTAASSKELGHRVFSWFETIPASAERTATLDLVASGVARPLGDGLWRYRLLVQSQPQLNPPPLAVHVSLPPRARLDEVQGPGAHAAGAHVRFQTRLDRDRAFTVTYCLCH